MVDLCKQSGLILVRMIATKEIKPSELMQAVLNRIDKVNPQLNAFCTVDPVGQWRTLGNRAHLHVVPI